MKYGSRMDSKGWDPEIGGPAEVEIIILLTFG